MALSHPLIRNLISFAIAFETRCLRMTFGVIPTRSLHEWVAVLRGERENPPFTRFREVTFSW